MSATRNGVTGMMIPKLNMSMSTVTMMKKNAFFPAGFAIVAR